MSREITYKDDRLTMIEGVDPMFGKFIQLYDKEMEYETPGGEGLVLDWSESMGFGENCTGIPGTDATIIAKEYIACQDFDVE
jgi:hypothetical protein